MRANIETRKSSRFFTIFSLYPQLMASGTAIDGDTDRKDRLPRVDDRRAAEPISHGANHNNGFRTDGAATAMAKAIAAVQTGYGDTCPMQLELSPGLTDDDSVAKIAALIRTHFDLGGTLFNINIIDKDKLLAAHKDPWAYPDLIVRVPGFTAYFATLSPEFRQLVVDRIVAE